MNIIASWFVHPHSLSNSCQLCCLIPQFQINIITTMSRPIIVLAPGAWHTPDCFDITREQLHQRGWETEAVAYPSVGAEPPTKGLADDAAALRSTLERLADDGKEIVLVVHSYGGVVGQNAVEGLGRKQRQAVGKEGGVVVFIYLAAFVVPKGASLKAMVGGQFFPWMRFDVRT
jgi:pimeloyl-ACP methyl ester carboxylesterase